MALAQRPPVKLTPLDAAPFARFGASVSINGDRVLVGAPQVDGGDGAAYVFERRDGVWQQTAKLRAPGAHPNGIAKRGVLLGDSFAFVAAGSQSVGASDPSSVVVFENQGGDHWVATGALSAPDWTALEDTSFGLDDNISYSENTLFVGRQSNSSVYVFEYDEDAGVWAFLTKLVGPKAGFGRDTAVCGDHALVISGGGVVFAYERIGGSWTETQQFFGTNFGAYTVALEGSHALFATTLFALGYFVEAYDLQDGQWAQAQPILQAAESPFSSLSVGGAAGLIVDPVGPKARVFDRQGGCWVEIASPIEDVFVAAAIDGSTAVFGDPADSELGLSSGAAWIYEDVLGERWADLGHALGGTNGSPCATGSGSLIGEDPVVMQLLRAREDAVAFLIVGLTQLNASLKGGTLVPALDLAGFPLALPTNTNGEVIINATWPAGIPSGFTTYYQYWIVDPAGPVGFSASNAISGTTP